MSSEPQTMQTMTDREMMGDALASQKLVHANYDICAGEAADNSLRATFMSLLKDELDIQADLFSQMQERGWYQVKPADQNEVSQARQKFNSLC